MAEIIDDTSSARCDSPSDIQRSTTIAHVLYGLHGLAPFTGPLLAVMAMIIGLIKRKDAHDTWLETHFSWLSRTFWWGLLWMILSWALFLFLVVITHGFGVFFAWIFPFGVFVWYEFRVVVGWLKLGDLKTIS